MAQVGRVWQTNMQFCGVAKVRRRLAERVRRSRDAPSND